MEQARDDPSMDIESQEQKGSYSGSTERQKNPLSNIDGQCQLKNAELEPKSQKYNGSSHTFFKQDNKFKWRISRQHFETPSLLFFSRSQILLLLSF